MSTINHNQSGGGKEHHGDHGHHGSEKPKRTLPELKKDLTEMLGPEILQDLEKFKTLKGEKLEEFIKTKIDHFRRVGGWYNATSKLDIIQAVELMMATGGDVKFLNQHRNMSALFDAIDELSGKAYKGQAYSNLSVEHLFEDIKAGRDGLKKGIKVYPVDEHGEYVPGIGIDIFDYAHAMLIREYLDNMHPDDLFNSGLEQKDDVIEKYLNGDPLIINIALRNEEGEVLDGGQTYRLDLRLAVQRPVVPQKSFEEYYGKVNDNQAFFQALSEMKDSALKSHSENGNHAFSQKTLGGKILYFPTSPKRANRGMQGELNKSGPGVRAGYDTHDMGWYEENTGLAVRYEANQVKTFRGDIKGPVESKGRTRRNLLALGSQEAALFNGTTKTFYFGKQTVDGKTKRGTIYKSMHNQYDKQMEATRGYKITENEIGDRIATDIIGVHLMMAPLDFVLNFGEVSGMWNSKQATEKQIVRESDIAKDPVPKFVFWAKIPPGFPTGEVGREDTIPTRARSNQYGYVTLKGITALVKYMNWRQSLGDIPGVSAPIAEDLVDRVAASGKTKDENKDKDKPTPPPPEQPTPTPPANDDTEPPNTDEEDDESAMAA